MNILDWAILALLVGSSLLGLLRGGTKEVLGLGGWIGGLVFAYLGAPLCAPLLSDLIAAQTLRWVAAFILIFIIVRLTAWSLGKLLAELIAAAKLGIFDKLIGVLYGVFRACVIVMVIAFLCMMTRAPQTTLWQSSTFTPSIQNAVIHLAKFLPLDFQRWIQQK